MTIRLWVMTAIAFLGIAALPGEIRAEPPPGMSIAQSIGDWTGFVVGDGDPAEHYIQLSFGGMGRPVHYDRGKCLSRLEPKSADQNHLIFNEVIEYVNFKMVTPVEPIPCVPGEIVLIYEDHHLAFSTTKDGKHFSGRLYLTNCALGVGPCEGIAGYDPNNFMGARIVQDLEKPGYEGEIGRAASLIGLHGNQTNDWYHYLYFKITHKGDFYYLNHAEGEGQDKLEITPLTRVIARQPSGENSVESYKVKIEEPLLRAAATSGLTVHLRSDGGVKTDINLTADQISAYLKKMTIPIRMITMVMTVPGSLYRTTCPEPAFPKGAKERGEQGAVLLRYLVGTDGRASEGSIVKSSGFADLDQAALATFLPCAFKPKTVNGEVVKDWVEVNYIWTQ